MKNRVTFGFLQLVFSAVIFALHSLLALNAPLHSAQPEDKEAGVFPWWHKADRGDRWKSKTTWKNWKGGLYRKTTARGIRIWGAPESRSNPASPLCNDAIKDAPPATLPHHPLLRGHIGHQGPWALGTRRRDSWHHWCSQSPTTPVSAAGYTLPFLPENVTWRGVPPLSALKIRRSRASSTCICFTGRVLSNTGTDGRSSGRGNLVTRCCNPAHTF